MSSSSDASSPSQQDFSTPSSPPASSGSSTPPPESTFDPSLIKDTPPPPSQSSNSSSPLSPDRSGGGSSSSPPSSSHPSPPPNSPPPSSPLSSPPPKSPPPSSPPPRQTSSPPPPSPSSSNSPPSQTSTTNSPPPSPSEDHGADSPKHSPPPSTTPSPPPSSPVPPTSDDSPSPAEKSAPQDFKSPPPPASGALPNINRHPGTPDTNPTPPPNSRAIPSSKTPSASNSSSKSGDSSSPPSAPKSSSSSSSLLGLAISMGVVAVAIIAVLCLIFMFCRKRKHRRSYVHAAPLYQTPDGNYYPPQHSGIYSGPHDPYYTQGSNPSFIDGNGSQRGGNPYHGPEMGNSKTFFSYEELMEITGGFSRQNVLGEGGFGAVYKGFLSDGKPVAVKQLKAGSGQGEREFQAEVEIISRVHHRHLVSLVGYCISDHHRLLIYEFVPNNTLEHHLHAKGIPVLDWSKRMKIAVGAAKGLAYLHEDCHPKIIHRDIKSANILLDDVYEAQVADFGLAKLSNDTGTHVSTRVMGTFGYMAPEYASSGKLTDRSDVFSFGVVLLELVTGRKPVDPTLPLGDESLVEWARPMLSQSLESGEVGELVDPKLEKYYVEGEMFRMIEAAAACVRHSATKRPRMAQVVRALDTDGGYDLSNGMKYGQSTVYESGQYNQDIMKFRMMALEGIGDSSEYQNHSGDYAAKELSRPPDYGKSSECTSGESETRAFTGSKNSHSTRLF